MAEATLNPNNLTGPQKAAVFLLAMGEEFSASFFKKLDEDTITKIGRHMRAITFVPADIRDRVLDDFSETLSSSLDMTVSGKEFLQQVITDTLDEDTAREIFSILGDTGPYIPFHELKYVPAESLTNIIKGEHPQTIALLLSQIDQNKAAEILNILPGEMKSDIAMRIVKLGNVQDELVRELDETITNEIASIKGGRGGQKFDGVDTLASILNEVDKTTEEDVLGNLEKEDSALTERIRRKMFIFEDLFEVDDRAFREILQNADNQTLAKALKTSTEEMKDKVYSNLSQRASEMLSEDIEVMGPMKLSDVEDAQQDLIKTAKNLEASGKIVLTGKGDDVFV